MTLMSILESPASFVAICFLVLLHEPANRRAVRLLRALRKQKPGK